MANMCSNYIEVVSDDPSNKNPLTLRLIEHLAEAGFEAYEVGVENEAVAFESNWNPPQDEFLKFLKTAGPCVFTVTYDEPGCQIYGILTYIREEDGECYEDDEKLEVELYPTRGLIEFCCYLAQPSTLIQLPLIRQQIQPDVAYETEESIKPQGSEIIRVIDFILKVGLSLGDEDFAEKLWKAFGCEETSIDLSVFNDCSVGTIKGTHKIIEASLSRLEDIKKEFNRVVLEP